MLKSERKQIILSQLKQDGFVTLENLTVLLSDTSESTIRRDLDELAADGQLKRVHGGAEGIHGLKEEIASSFDGVQTSFALQAGREIRIMVHPNKISDDEVTILSHKVREQIEKNLDYPGNIKVTVIREFRAVDYAK